MPQQARQRWLVWSVFAGATLWLGWTQNAADLTASYLAGRMMAQGDAASLYRPLIAAVHWRTDPVWAHTVAASGIPAEAVTGYVQTPLWAWLVAPLARHLSFPLFKRLFAALTAAATVTLVAQSARHWAPRLYSLAAQAGLLAGLFVTTPFLWGVILGQTHAIFLCLAVLAAIRAANGKPLSAGALLAGAAAVKITPLWLAVTWLAAGRWRAALSFAAFSSLFALLAILCAGPAACAAYLAALHVLSGRILLSFNNNALAALLLNGQLTPATAFQWQTVPLPPAIVALSTALLAACAAAAGWQDRKIPAQPGAILTLVAATAFAPLAWNHYFIVLILPTMLFLQNWREGQGRRWLALCVTLMLLNLPPLAYMGGDSLWVIALRSHLLAALLSIAGLLASPDAGKRQLPR